MHHSVLLHETLEALRVVEGGCYADCTLGRGGHSLEILKRAGAEGRLLGIDRDSEALERARVRLEGVPGRVEFAHGAHGDLAELANGYGFEAFDGIVVDLGVSSEQLDTAERGFSFRFDGALDMRMDRSQGESAAELVARLDVDGLTVLLRSLGEEPQARRVARAIVAAREQEAVATTGRLAEIVSRAKGGRKGSRHPATRVFQALRMAVNRELEELESVLDAGLELLRPGGRMVVITFESLSDRVVKRRFAAHVGRMVSLMEGGERWEGRLPAMVRVTRKAVVPSAEEVAENPRARSAKLRAVERREF